MTQLALPLENRPALGREDFLVTPANADAVAWVDKWPDWPAHTLAIYGPSGCGKTHLAHVFMARSGGLSIAAADLAAGLDLADLPAIIVVEDGPVGPEGEKALFHLINWVRETGGSLLLTGETPPAQWRVAIPDLASRLGAIAAVAIQAPDERLLAAVMVKMFADRQIALDARVLEYALKRIDRSYAAVKSLVEKLDAASLAEKKPVSIPLAKKILSAD